MKKILFIASCLCALNISYAQTAAPIAAQSKTAKKTTATGKCAVTGTIRDMHNFPVNNVQVFVYAADSSIIASGYTDETGRFETNAVAPGAYNVKVVYPSQKATVVTAVVLKSGLTPMNIKAEQPTEDNTIAYADIAPKAEGKKQK